MINTDTPAVRFRTKAPALSAGWREVYALFSCPQPDDVEFLPPEVR